MPGFGGVTEKTFQPLRRSLAEEERNHAKAHPDDSKEAWSVGPILKSSVGDAAAMSKEAISKLKQRQETIRKRLSELSEAEREKFERGYQARLEHKMFEMSGTATRPGELGEPGRNAIRAGLECVKTIDAARTPHSDAYLQLNKAMAVDDQATGAKKDQFGKPRDKPVALPVLFPSEPRVEAMPVACLAENMSGLDDYVSSSLKDSSADPIELIAKQYMTDVTIHPCVDANGRSSLMATFPLADKFGLPWPLVTKKGSEVFHCQDGQAEDGHAMHPAEVMAHIVEGMSNNLALQEALLDDPESLKPCGIDKCGGLAWANVQHRCGLNAFYCDKHMPKSVCPRCSDIGIKTAFV